MREKIRLNSSAGTGHFYTTDKNKRTMPEKMEVKKYEDALNEIDSSSQKGKADKSLLEGALNSARSKLKQLRGNN